MGSVRPQCGWATKSFGSRAFALCLALFIAGPALANPEVKLEWISKGGVDIVPPSDTVIVTEADIAADTELVLRISLVLDEVAIHEFGFVLLFDTDDRYELDLDPSNFPQAQDSYGPFLANGFFQAHDSDEGFGEFGELGPYRGCVEVSVCDTGTQSFNGTPLSNQTVIVDEISFLATVDATNDHRDIQIDDVPFNSEFRGVGGSLIPYEDITFGHASVVPEPGESLLAASALLTLAVLVRRRSVVAL